MLKNIRFLWLLGLMWSVVGCGQAQRVPDDAVTVTATATAVSIPTVAASPVPTPVVTPTAMLTAPPTSAALLFNQAGQVFQFDLGSQTVQPVDLPAQGQVVAALLGGNGRFLAFTDDDGLKLYDMTTSESQLKLPSTTNPWEQFRPRAWNQAGDLLVQRTWITESTTPVWLPANTDSWQPLPLPADSTAEFYGYDSGAAWSLDGAQLALGGYDYGIPSNVPGLTVINLETGEPQRIVTRMIASGLEDGEPIVAGAHDPAWSPNGELIAFSLAEDAVEPLTFPRRLYLVRPDGTELTPLTENTQGHASHPIWTADGNLYYGLIAADGALDGIHYIDLTTQTDSLLIPGSNLAPVMLSADEGALIYTRSGLEGVQDLMLWIADTSENTLISEGQNGSPPRFVGWVKE